MSLVSLLMATVCAQYPVMVLPGPVEDLVFDAAERALCGWRVLRAMRHSLLLLLHACHH